MSCRILVVDDSESFRRTATRLLAARGLEPLAAAPDGETALAAVSAACPDGILLDINLPGRDGFAVAALITAACPAPPSCCPQPSAASATLRSCGAAAFVPKIELATTDLKTLFARPGSRPC
jgi:CheY-like chemotaxis protein